MNEYNIQAASQLSGVSIHQLRIWEKRYQAVKPKRNSKNFRSYSHDDIIRLKLLGTLARSGFAISKIARLSTADLQAKYDFLQASQQELAVEGEEETTNERSELLLKLFEARQLSVLKHEVSKLRTLASIASSLLPLLRRILSTASLSGIDAQELSTLVLTQIERISLEHTTSFKKKFKKDYK